MVQNQIVNGCPLEAGHCLLRGLVLVAFLFVSPATYASSGDRPTVNPREEVRARLRIEASRFQELGDARSLRDLVQQSGELGLVESIPDLVFLLDNTSNSYLAEVCIRALGQIEDKRVLIPLAGELRWETAGSTRLARAIEAIEGLGWPLAPTLFRALASGNELMKRRAILAIDLLGRDRVRDTIREHSNRGRVFELPPDVTLHLLPLLNDPSPVVRYEALNAYLSISGSSAPEALKFVADDSSRSVQQISIRARNEEYKRTWTSDGWLALRALALEGLAPRQYSKRSAWVPWRGDLELRVSLSQSDLTLSESAYLLNPPVWIQVELRNGGSETSEVTTDTRGIPLVRLEARDEFGFKQEFGMYPRISHYPTESTALTPGSAIVWSFHLLRHCRFWANGRFTIHGDSRVNGDPLLSFDVSGIPGSPWRRHPRLGQGQGAIAYSRQELKPLPETPPSRLASEPTQPEGGMAVPDLLVRFVRQGDREALVSLTHQFSIDGITELLREMRPDISRNRTASQGGVIQGSILKEGRFEEPRLFIDPAGNRHLVVLRTLLSGKDLASEVYYARGERDGWSQPVAILGDGTQFMDQPQLAMSGDGTLFAFVAVHRREPWNWRSSAKPKPLEYDVLLRRREPGEDWGPVEHCLPAKPGLLRGFDVAVDGSGTVHLVWAPWFGKGQRQRIHHRSATASGWEPEQVLPSIERDLINPRIRFVNDQGVVLATGRPPNDSTGKFGLFRFRATDAGWSAPELMEDGLRGTTGPTSEAPHLFAASSAVETFRGNPATLHKLTTAGTEELNVPFWLPISGRYIDRIAMASAPDGTAFGLTSWWSGVPILFRTTSSGNTEAIALSGPRPRASSTMGLPDIAVYQDEWYGLWPLNDRSGGSLYYSHGPIAKRGWTDALSLTFQLRPAVGLLPSDLYFIQAGVLTEAQAAEAQGRPLERYCQELCMTLLFRRQVS